MQSSCSTLCLTFSTWLQLCYLHNSSIPSYGCVSKIRFTKTNYHVTMEIYIYIYPLFHGFSPRPSTHHRPVIDPHLAGRFKRRSGRGRESCAKFKGDLFGEAKWKGNDWFFLLGRDCYTNRWTLYMTLMIEILLRICSCVSCLLCSRWCCEDTTTDASLHYKCDVLREKQSPAGPFR